MPFENNSWSGRYEKLYVRSRNNLGSIGAGLRLGVKRCGATVATNTIAPVIASKRTMVGATARKTDFHAARWSAKSIGQITSSCAINGQSDIPPCISIPIDMWNRLTNIAPSRNVRIRLAVSFIELIIAKSRPVGRPSVSCWNG